MVAVADERPIAEVAGFGPGFAWIRKRRIQH
jgi:hypothetical protein